MKKLNKMDLYGKKSKSIPQKLIIIGLELILLYFAYYILFNKGGTEIYKRFGIAMPEGNLYRRIIIFCFSFIVFLRITFAMFVFVKRRIPFEESISIPFAFALYYIGFAVFGYGTQTPVGIFDYFGVAVFLFGSYLNTFSEYQRYKWKKDPNNKGKLYTIKLFRHSIHINYFGDLLWVIGYSILTLNIWSVWIPILLFFFFIFFNIPKLDTYLAEKYKTQFSNYKKQTKKFIPFIY
ncbi:MAG: DUF1295 domain-containing protein [Bacteroidales bacterium]|nr:DUF1295 domain-containing protein [Bacteroidales bacterium]